MKMCRHAKIQAQRRAISQDLVDLVIGNGDQYKAGRRCRIYRISSKERKYLKSECPRTFWDRHRDRLSRVTAVVSDGDKVLTAMHRYKAVRTK